MRKILKYFIIILAFVLPLGAMAQEDLMNMLDDGPQTDYAYGTFKTTRVVLNHSVQAPAPGELVFIISHHFGRINEGAYNFWGLDAATIRLGLEYSLNNYISFGVGRGTWKKMYDGHLKLKLLRQSSGKRTMPITLSYFTSIGVNSLHWQDPNRDNYFSSRLSYVHQLLIARKFNETLSLQLTPTMVHRNLVAAADDQNDVFAMGAGGRVKLTRRTSLNVEYFYLLPGKTADNFNNSLSVGFDIETGGHVFQLFFTNSNPITEHGFITETVGRWDKGDIFFGFNITRTFTIVKPKL
ncbi:MAG: DUF5777 family beta-barrel protein [Bacteroidales bacterium]